MLARVRSPLGLVRGGVLGRLERHPPNVRFKSEQSRQVDDFPYKHLSQRDVSNMSAAMESTTRLPLRSFFAQHRTLMPFGKPEARREEEQLSSGAETRWVHVPVSNGRFPIFMTDERAMWNVLPEGVAKKLGPFNREAVLRSKAQGVAPQSPQENAEAAGSVEALTPTELQSVLSKRFPILMEHLQKMANTDGEVQFIPLTFEKVPKAAEEDGVEATSVRRKRKLKMNRHKYRKRLKEQRTKRRRLGK